MEMSKERLQRRVPEIVGILLIALAILMLLSLISHSPDDPPNASYPAAEVSNWAGRAGAYLSYGLRFLMGYGAYPLVLLVLGWGWNRLRSAGVRRALIRTCAALMGLVLYCGASGIPAYRDSHTAFALGGWLGVMLSSSVLVPFFGRIGAWVVVLALLAIALLIGTDMGFDRVGAALVSGWRMLMSLRGRGSRSQPPRRTVRSSKETLEETPILGGAEPSPEEAPEDPPIIGGSEPPPEEEASTETEEATVPDEAEPTAPEEDLAEPIIAPAEVDLEPFEDEAEDAPDALSRKRRRRERKYDVPSPTLLDEPPDEQAEPSKEELLRNAEHLERSLLDFGVEGRTVQVSPGPVITRYEVEPAAGVKVGRISALDNDLALVMKARRVRIQAPIPGKGAVGIEIPNADPAVVYLREILESEIFQDTRSRLTLALGKTISGESFCTDLTRMPHLLIAGATGSGKSVCINALISSLLFRHAPEQVRFIMVDPKVLELTMYNEIPHLLTPVVSEAKKTADALRWAVAEMEARYRRLADASVRNIADYNRRAAAMGKDVPEEERLDTLPYIVIIIDELADLMMVASREVEEPIARLAQMARAVGIHLIVATQRPSVDVLTGVIKANFPTRIAFQVASKVDSRTILDINGAENLLGSGDMLFLPPGRGEPIRIHGAYISTEETERLVKTIRKQGFQAEEYEIFDEVEGVFLEGEGVRDELFDDAVRLVVQLGQASASLLQRRMKIGYARAGRLIDEMEAAGIVGPPDGGRAREVLVDVSYLEDDMGGS